MNAFVPQIGVPSDRAKTIGSRSRMTNRVARQNLETGKLEWSEGILNRNFARLATFDDKVVSFKEEPCKLVVDTGKRVFTCYPDFEVILDDGTVEYVEVKPLTKCVEPETEKRLVEIGEYLDSKGYVYRVMTEKDINKSDVLMSNLALLEQIQRMGEFTVEELTPMVPNKDVALDVLVKRLDSRSMVYSMLAYKLVFFDLESEINSSTILNIRGGDQYAELY